MADEYVNVTVHGKTFDMKVPKGASDDYIKTAATNYHDLTYGPVVKPPSLPGMEQAAPVDSNIQSHLTGPTQHQENSGFWSSAGDALKGLGSAVMHPIDTFNTMVHAGQLSPELKARMNDPHADRGMVEQQIYSHLLDDPIIPFSTANKVATGNIRGALGDIAPSVVLGALMSPKIRGAIGGGTRGLTDSLTDSHVNVRKNSIPALAGGAIGAAKGGWPGFLAGSAVGGILPEVPNIIKEGMRGAVVGAADKPLIPKLMRDHETLHTSATPSAQPPTFNPQLERGPINMPGPGLSTPPAQLQLGPATQIQMPSSTFGTYVRPKELPLPEHGFWRGPGATPLKPGPEEYFAPRRTNFPIKPDDAPLKPADASKVSAPKDEVQQVPAATRTVDEALPSEDALKVNGPQEENVQNEKSEPEQEETKKTYITRENLYNIAKEMGEVPTSLARWMLKNDYDLEKPVFGNAWDEKRPTKTQPSETKLKTKEVQANANHALFSKMVPEIAKQHPEWF